MQPNVIETLDTQSELERFVTLSDGRVFKLDFHSSFEVLNNGSLKINFGESLTKIYSPIAWKEILIRDLNSLKKDGFFE